MEIVGVMPAGFRVLDTDADLILPLRFDRSTLMLPGFGFQGIARLKPGVTMPDADADIGRMVPIWMNSWPAAKGVNPRVYEAFRITPALRSLHAEVVGNVGDVLWIVMATIGIVLLVACANVATLLLVRAEGRQQELAVRASLGAGRGRIVRGLLLESLLLALISGVRRRGARLRRACAPSWRWDRPTCRASATSRWTCAAWPSRSRSRSPAGCCSGCCRRSGTAGPASGTPCAAADARRPAAASATVPAACWW